MWVRLIGVVPIFGFQRAAEGVSPRGLDAPGTHCVPARLAKRDNKTDHYPAKGWNAAPRQIRSPKEPTAAEVAEHEVLGHIQYREWCRHCVAASSTEAASKKRENRMACPWLHVITASWGKMTGSLNQSW